MKNLRMGAIAALIAIALLSAPGVAECVVTSAPSESLSVNLPGNPGGIDYVEEREIGAASDTLDRSRGEGRGYGEPSPTTPPPYLWGFLFGEGSWHYEEANGLPGLQAGGLEGIIPNTCNPDPLPLARACQIVGEQVQDETCGAGPDRWVV